MLGSNFKVYCIVTLKHFYYSYVLEFIEVYVVYFNKILWKLFCVHKEKIEKVFLVVKVKTWFTQIYTNSTHIKKCEIYLTKYVICVILLI